MIERIVMQQGGCGMGASAVADVSMTGVDVAVCGKVMILRVQWVRQESLWSLNSSNLGFIRRGGLVCY